MQCDYCKLVSENFLSEKRMLQLSIFYNKGYETCFYPSRYWFDLKTIASYEKLFAKGAINLILRELKKGRNKDGKKL